MIHKGEDQVHQLRGLFHQEEMASFGKMVKVGMSYSLLQILGCLARDDGVFFPMEDQRRTGNKAEIMILVEVGK